MAGMVISPKEGVVPVGGITEIKVSFGKVNIFLSQYYHGVAMRNSDLNCTRQKTESYPSITMEWLWAMMFLTSRCF